jgi:hypothetical protein
MAEYDSKVIHKFADRLYSQARTILISYPLLGGLILAGIIYGFELYSRTKINHLIGFIVGALIGYLIATEKAFKLKLEAQTALCQAKIEENTRK